MIFFCFVNSQLSKIQFFVLLYLLRPFQFFDAKTFLPPPLFFIRNQFNSCFSTNITFWMWMRTNSNKHFKHESANETLLCKSESGMQNDTWIQSKCIHTCARMHTRTHLKYIKMQRNKTYKNNNKHTHAHALMFQTLNE